MIKINLLPPEMAKSKRERVGIAAIPSSATPFVAVILIVAYIIVGAFAYRIINAKRIRDNEVKQLTQEREKLKKEVQDKQVKFRELMELKTLVTNQLEILGALDPPNRLYWSEKMNMLADLVPKGVYLTNITVSEQIAETETEASKQRRATWVQSGSKGAAPPVIKKPVITQTLNIAGITWSDDPEQRLQLIIRFHDAMKNYSYVGHNNQERHFMDNFENLIRIDPTYVDSVSARTINRFRLILRTKPFTSKE